MSAAYLPLELHYEIHGESLRKEVSSGSHVLGREPGCEVVLNHPSVSRHHARLTLQRAAWEVRDLGSMNGTKVKGRRVESAEIADGDTVRVGDVDIVCRLGLLTPRAEELFLSAEEEEASDAVATSVHVDDLDSAVASMLASEARRPGVGATGPTSVRDPAWVVRVVQEAAGALLGELELNGVLRRILDLVFDNLPAHRGLVLLLEGNRLVPMAERAREGHAMQEMRISRRIAERASRAREAVLVRPRSEAGRTPSMVAMNVHSAVCAPLCHEGRVVGLLYVDRTSMDETFTETDRGVLSVLATLSGAAVERAQLRQSFEKERALRSRLSAYLAPAVVDHLVERRTAEFPSMASMEREISVLFGDIVGFTALSETLEPREVTSLLNDLFGRMSEIVFEEEGTLDKFIGDNMMVFFGAPMEQPDHALRAVRTGLAMQRCVRDFNAERGQHLPILLRVGINTGQAIVGDVGAPRRRDYTVIGDTVNVASRLESAVSKPGQVVIGPLTYDRVARSFRCEPLQAVPLKGKLLEVQPYLVCTE